MESEAKMHIRSVVYFGWESLGALKTDAKRARVAPGMCAEPEYLGWTLGQGSRSMRNDPQKDRLNSI